MKAILEFELPQEQEEHKNAVEGTAWKAAMQNADNEMRNNIKHNPRDLTDEQIEGLEEARSILREVCYDFNLELF